ncbi:MAG: MGMT family protein [Candidatus Baldrarchaeia archaeon]
MDELFIIAGRKENSWIGICISDDGRLVCSTIPMLDLKDTLVCILNVLQKFRIQRPLNVSMLAFRDIRDRYFKTIKNSRDVHFVPISKLPRNLRRRSEKYIYKLWSAWTSGGVKFSEREVYIMDKIPRFDKEVLSITMKIPRGFVTTYGEISKVIAGTNRYARKVARILARNPLPLVIPCHRVIMKDRSLGGYSYGAQHKWNLLTREGIPISEKGLVPNEYIIRAEELLLLLSNPQ